jgi:hypothetical protein
MTIQDFINDDELCILVEGSKRAEAEFLAQWLLAAAKADKLWKKAVKDASFQEAVRPLTPSYFPKFGMAAAYFLSKQFGEHYFPSFVVRLNGKGGKEGVAFAMMVHVGFFGSDGQRYQMVVPPRLSVAKLKAAFTELIKAVDDEGRLHPEWLVAAMPYAEAVARQRRQRAADEFQRYPASSAYIWESTIH